MTFTEATDVLLQQGISLTELGDALGISSVAVHASRLPREDPLYQDPPEEWRRRLAAFIRARVTELSDLARALAP